MRNFCFIIACIFGGALAAETIGNVEFQFPPSTYDWALLTDTTAYSSMEEDSEFPAQMKMYTHKAGDALEFFTAMNIEGDDQEYEEEEEDEEDEEEEEEPFQTAEFCQLFINDLLMAHFPNHRIAITNMTETKEDAFVEWEISDGIQQIFHGLCRCLIVDGNTVILSYMTTMTKNSENSALWTDALNQARVIE